MCIRDRYITFRDTYGGDNDRTYFLQQRWNQLEILALPDKTLAMLMNALAVRVSLLKHTPVSYTHLI